MSESAMNERGLASSPNPAVPYLSAVVVLVIIVAFAYVFGTEIWHCWKPPEPGWIQPLHSLLNSLATLVGGIVAVSFAIKPPSKPGAPRGLHALWQVNLTSLGQFAAPVGTERLQVLLGAIYAIVYVILGFAAIGTWAYRGSAITSPDVKGLASTFAGMIPPIVMAFFSQ
jgi:hypothetical protein